MKFKEALQSDVTGPLLDALVGDPVLGTTFRTFNLNTETFIKIDHGTGLIHLKLRWSFWCWGWLSMVRDNHWAELFSMLNNQLVKYLACDVVDQSLHTWFHTERMLTWQQLGVTVAVQADGTCQQLIKLLHFQSKCRCEPLNKRPQMLLDSRFNPRIKTQKVDVPSQGDSLNN